MTKDNVKVVAAVSLVIFIALAYAPLFAEDAASGTCVASIAETRAEFLRTLRNLLVFVVISSVMMHHLASPTFAVGHV